MLAFSGSVQCSEPLWFRVGTEDDCLFRYETSKTAYCLKGSIF